MKVQNIDWKLLSKQKLDLVEVIMNNETISNEERDSLDGILHLIDHLEDEILNAHFSFRRTQVNKPRN